MYKIFKLINNCKFIYKNPKINDLVVLDIEGIEYLDNVLKNRNYYVNHNEILKFLKKNDLLKKTHFKRFIPIVTKNYDVRLKTDKDLRFIDLKEFGYK